MKIGQIGLKIPNKVINDIVNDFVSAGINSRGISDIRFRNVGKDYSQFSAKEAADTILGYMKNSSEKFLCDEIYLTNKAQQFKRIQDDILFLDLNNDLPKPVKKVLGVFVEFKASRFEKKHYTLYSNLLEEHWNAMDNAIIATNIKPKKKPTLVQLLAKLNVIEANTPNNIIQEYSIKYNRMREIHVAKIVKLVKKGLKSQ